MVRDHGNPRIAVVLFQDGYRFIYILYCMLCQDGDCDVTVRTLYMLSLIYYLSMIKCIWDSVHLLASFSSFQII